MERFLSHCSTTFCLSKNALTTGNFAHKIKAYENREIQGIALPEKEQTRQVGQSSHHGTYHRQSFDGAVQLQNLLYARFMESS